MNIGQFTKFIKKTNISGPIYWVKIYEEHGYIRVLLPTHNYQHWTEIQDWCTQNIGVDHYTWTGPIFWFDNQLTASWFIWRWA